MSLQIEMFTCYHLPFCNSPQTHFLLIWEVTPSVIGLVMPVANSIMPPSSFHLETPVEEYLESRKRWMRAHKHKHIFFWHVLFYCTDF